MGLEARDAVVIGSGLAGLAAGAVLAQRGLSVTVAERGSAAGGYAHSFHRGPYVLDPAIHVIQEAREGQVQDVILRELGVRDRVNFLEVDPLWDVRFPDFSLQAPAGGSAFTQAYADAFPGDAERVADFFELCGRLHNEAHGLPPQVSLRELDSLATRFPTLFGHQKRTTAEVLDEWFDDHRLKAAVTACWPFIGAPPSQLDFVTFAQLLTVMVHGSFFIEGGFQMLVDALVAALEEGGGELLLGSSVEKITIEDGAATGVRLANGGVLPASAVISAADATQTLEGLVGPDHLPRRYLNRLRRMQPSLSAFVAFFSSTMDLGATGIAHDMLVYNHWDHDRTWAEIQAARPGVKWMNIATLVDPSLAPEGEHLLVLTAEAPYDVGRPWNEIKDGFLDQMLTDFEAEMPGLRESLTLIEVATPEAFRGFTSNRDGAMLGWAPTPQQSGSRRLSTRTPIDGLMLAGHWAQPGGGSIRSLASGVMAARIILHRVGAEDFEIPLSLEAAW